MGPLFDRYVAVDWSASSRPVTGADSIWVAVVDRDGDPEPVLANPSTRDAAEAHLVRLLDEPATTLLAFDASLGYPSGTAAWFGLAGDPPWRAMWAQLERTVGDDGRNANDRFDAAARLNRRGGAAGPFWGCPAATPRDGLAPTKPASFPVPEFRRCELALRDRGLRPMSGWQLLGAGSVGSQTLTLLPRLDRWWRAGRCEVWPFTTGLRVPTGARVVVVETWPTAFDVDIPAGWVRDAAQVAAVVRRLGEADRTGALGTWFEPALSAADRMVAEAEEGWVLAPPPG